MHSFVNVQGGPIDWFVHKYDLTENEDEPVHQAVKKQCIDVCLDAELADVLASNEDEDVIEEEIAGGVATTESF